VVTAWIGHLHFAQYKTCANIVALGTATLGFKSRLWRLLYKIINIVTWQFIIIINNNNNNNNNNNK
jgi:hypothetical protein